MEGESHGSKTVAHRRFAMEFIEARVLLSADVLDMPALIEPPKTNDGELVQQVTAEEISDGNTANVQPQDQGEEEDAGDFVDSEAYDQTYGTFDYDTFLNLDNNGPLGGQGGAVDEVAAPADVLTNNNAGATSTVGFTQSETAVIAYGNTVLVAFNDSGSTSGGTNKFTGFARSTDNGNTFVDGGVLPTNSTGDGGDPVLARNDATGRVFFATLQASTTPVNGIAVFHSDNDGLTWSAPVQGAPGKPTTGLQDKEWIAVDNFAGAGNGNVYLTERDFGPGNGIYFYRSIDNGNTFGPSGGTLIASAALANVQGAFVTVAPDHSVYVFWYAGANIQMRKSVDQGLTFGAPVTVATFLSLDGGNGDLALTGTRQGTALTGLFRSSKFPEVAVNPVNGNIYVTYNDNPVGADKADVFVVQSTNGGTTWSAPIKVNDDTTTTDQWQPALAVTPAGDKLGIFYYSRQEDPTGNNLFKYYGRIANIFGSTLTFTPGFAVSDTPSLPEFGRDSVVNPVYMGDYNTASATPGFFEVSWSDNRDDLVGGIGQKDPNVYFKSIDLGLNVRSTSPAVGSVVSTPPVDYVVNFSDPIQNATVNATDFTVDGIAANSFVVNTATQVTFHFTSAPFATQGLHTMAMAAGAILRSSDGDELAAFSGNFRYDAVQLRITSTAPPIIGGVFMLPGPFTLDANFNEAINPASVQTWDLVLGGIAGAAVTGVTVLPGNTTARFTISGITTQGVLTANVMAGAISDAFGNPGTSFVSQYSVDLVTASFPTPLTAKNPLGSLIYDPSATGFITPAGDTDSFTLSVDTGQTITVKVAPTSSTLQPSVQLIDPSGALIGSSAAGGANQNALLQTVAAAMGGTYQIVVGGAGGSTGSYTVQATINAGLENEGNILGVTNNIPTSSEQTINAIDTGNYASPGSHTSSDSGYQTGVFIAPPSIVVEFRNYATFSLPASTPTILSAELRMVSGSYSSPDPTETYSLFDVTATPAALDTNHNGDLAGIGIFGDLGSGNNFGSRVVSAADTNTTVAITLNAAAVTALNAAIGSTISIGGALTTLAGTAATQTMFGGTSSGLGNIQLVIHTATPVITAENIDSSFITLSTPQGSAQRGAVLGQTDASTYSATAVPFTFEDISATGILITPLTNQDNTVVSGVPFGFSFPHYGVMNTTVAITSNGLLTLASGLSVNASGINTDLTTSPTQATIAPFWDDLHTGGGVAGSNVYVQTTGTGANQHLTVQWNNVRFLNGGATGDTITFEAQMFADGRIQFNYLDLVSGSAPGNNGASATVGIKAAGTQGPDRLLLAFNNGPNAFVGTGKSTLITPTPVPDYYAFTLHGGEKATLAATSQTSDVVSLEIRDSNDTVLATGIGADNLTSVISNFAVATGGTYFARIMGGGISVPYSLVITRDAVFDTEENSTAATAQTLDGTQGALGAIMGAATVNAVDSGWIATDGTHTAANNNYAVGQVLFNSNPLSEFRNYATFALSGTTPTIIGAELRLFNPTNAYSSPDPTETYTLFDVSATPTALDANRLAGDATGSAIHADLGSGTVYGARVVSAADNNTTIAITLNAAAVAALNAAIGSTISFGGAITTIAGTAMQSVFGFTSGAAGTVQLVLQTVTYDWYSITMPVTANALRLETSTPGDGPGEPVNTLNPKIELYDTTGTTLLASGVARPDGRNESIVITGLTPGATYKVRVAGESGTTGEYFLTRNFDFSPVVTSLSAVPINENDIATLNGTFSDLDVLDTHTVIVTWGPGEGSTTLNLAAGVLTFSATHQYLDDNPTATPSNIYPIGVTVTDNRFGSGSGDVNLTVNNVAPDVAPISGPSSAVRGQELDFSGSFTDVGTLDTQQVRWDFGDGTVIDFHSTTDPNALTAPTHVYSASGVYTLTLSVRDDDGGLTSVRRAVTITAVAIEVDPCDSTKTALVVGGTTDSDVIVFNPQGNSGDIQVLINGVSEGVFHPTGLIIAYGQAGDDDIQVAGSIPLQSWLFGNDGNDRLKGGAGGSILLGGAGDDLLIGGNGRSILIGGDGQDRLVGGSGDDILIGGSTSFDNNATFLCALMDGWSSTVDAYSVRVAKVRLLLLLTSNTVIDDGMVDKLTGSSGVDWLFAGVGDVATDQKPSENVG
jgi:hypothetical protein